MGRKASRQSDNAGQAVTSVCDCRADSIMYPSSPHPRRTVRRGRAAAGPPPPPPSPPPPDPGLSAYQPLYQYSVFIYSLSVLNPITAPRDQSQYKDIAALDTL